MLDFSHEEEQREMAQGPVPAGSMVVLEMTVLEPFQDRQAPDEPLISVARSGLRQIYCQFAVTGGTYAGVSFRQNITLPASMQKIQITGTYQTACAIGGATLKAICVASGRQPLLKSLRDFTGMRFPAKVRINNRPREKDGVEYWNNEIARVITPDMPDYSRVCQEGEIINPKGAVKGNGKSGEGNGNQGGQEFPEADGQAYEYDAVPF